MKIKKKVQVCVLAPQNNNFYLLRLQTNKRRGEFWQNITGGVDKKEELEVAAIREFEEETGLERSQILKKIKLDDTCTFHFIDQWQKNIEEHSFCFVLKEVSDVSLDPNEHQNYEWKDITKITNKDFKYENNFKVFEKAIGTL